MRSVRPPPEAPLLDVRVGSRFGRRAFVGIAFAAAGCGGARERPVIYPGGESSSAVLALENEMFLRVNADRAQRGLPPLIYEPALADIARNHAADMKEARFFAHESARTGGLDQRMVRWEFRAKVARENLAEAPTVQIAEDGLLKSPHHYENLMANDITHIGIGIVRGGVGDARNLLAVQVFAKPIEALSNDDLLERVLAKIQAARRGMPALARDAMLDDLAASYVESIPVSMDQAALARETKRALASLPRDSRYRGLMGFAALVYDAADMTPPQAALQRNVVALGVAAAEDRDDRGAPCHKLVVLFAFA